MLQTDSNPQTPRAQDANDDVLAALRAQLLAIVAEHNPSAVVEHQVAAGVDVTVETTWTPPTLTRWELRKIEQWGQRYGVLPWDDPEITDDYRDMVANVAQYRRDTQADDARRIAAEEQANLAGLIAEAVRDTLELAADTGRIGSTVPKSNAGVLIVKTPMKGTARFCPKPDKPRRLKCSNHQWGKGTDTYGWGYKMSHPCNDCPSCVAFALDMKAWRWDVGRGPFQTSIMVNGAANADEARKWTGSFAKAINLPNRASLVTDAGEIWIVSADPLDYDTIERILDFAAADHGNCKRPAMQCTVKTENVKGGDLVAFVKGNRTAQGEQRHVSFRLHGAAFVEGPVEDDFSLGDATPLAEDEPTPTAVVLSPQAKKSRAWRKIKNPKKRERARLIARAEQTSLWCDGKNLITYTGPTKMLKQYADYRAGRREYEPAWDYVAQLYEG